MSLENPYAPPVGPIEAVPEPGVSFSLSNNEILIRGLVCSLIGVGAVLLYQVFFTGISLNSFYRLPFSASFGVCPIAILFAFGVCVGNDHRDRVRNVIATLVLAPLALAAMSIAESVLRLVNRELALGAALSMLWFSQVSVLLAILRMQNLPIRSIRIIGVGVLATAVWVALTFLIIAALLRNLSHPLDDCVGYSSLTMFWAWTTIAQIPLVLRTRSRVAA